MENDNELKNLAKLAKLERQIKTGQEKIKSAYIKKFAPPKKRAKREYAHFPARDNDGRLIRHPGRKRKFAEIDQNKGTCTTNLIYKRIKVFFAFNLYPLNHVFRINTHVEVIVFVINLFFLSHYFGNYRGG